MSSTKSSPSDFSLFSLFTAGLAYLVPLASAYTQPVGDAPKGNPFGEPGLNSVVPVSKNFTVTWNPTTTGTVTLVLLKGPSTNIKPLYAIAEKIDNSGSFVWMPKTDLAPGPTADTGYGIQLIVDATGQYQYTTQFGISNPDHEAGTAPSSKSPTVYSNSSHHSTTALSSPVPANGAGAYPTHHPPGGSYIVRPTGSMTLPLALITTASPPATGGAYSSGTGVANATSSQKAPLQTNAAAGMATSFAGLVVAAGVAVLAL